MTDTPSTWQERWQVWRDYLASNLTAGDYDSLPGVLILLVASVVLTSWALLQLLTMWGTKWGDSNLTRKSLFLSVLIHVAVMFGWSTAINVRLVGGPPTNINGEEPVEVIPVLDYTQRNIADDPTPAHPDAPVPIWKKPLEAAELTPTRTAAKPTEIPPDEAPAPLETNIDTAVTPDIPDLKNRPDEPDMVPTPLVPDQAGPPVVAAMPQAIEEPAMDATPGPPKAPAAAARRVIAAQGTPVNPDLPITQNVVEPGLPKATGPMHTDSLNLSIPIFTSPDGDLPIREGVVADKPKRRAAPAATDSPDSEALPSTPTPSGISTATAPTGNKFQRSPAARVKRDDGGTAQPFDQPGTPTTPNPANAGVMAARPGLTLGTPDATSAPDLVRPDSQTLAGRKPRRSPTTYRLRKLEQRADVALKNGGTNASERAVEASLRFLASAQEPDGRWNPAAYGGGRNTIDPNTQQDRHGAGRTADSGVTALAILCFLGAGYTHEEGEYAETVQRGLQYLIEHQDDDGFLGAGASHYEQMYCHGMAAYALAEAYGMQSDAQANRPLRDAVARASAFIIRRQNNDGGWRYIDKKDQDGDMSMFGWQLMALKSAEIAGLDISLECRRSMRQFLEARSLGRAGGLASYRLGASERPTNSMTAEALFCKQILLGLRRNEPAAIEAVNHLRTHPPRLTDYDEYYWYYGTLAMFQTGGTPWKEWNESLREMLIQEQRKTGDLAGSWDPRGKWSGLGGRLYSTTLSTLCLEVYYRFLPLNQIRNTD